jgi:hypothetical protein
MFEVLAQFAVARGAMLSGPKCQDGAFVGNDDWVGNNDQNNKLQQKGECNGQRFFGNDTEGRDHEPENEIKNAFWAEGGAHYWIYKVLISLMLCAGVNLGNWDLDVALGVQFDDNCLTGQNVKNTIFTALDRRI